MYIREKRAKRNIRYATDNLIGSYENTLEDFSEDDEMYQESQKCLADHKGLVSTVYNMAINAYYDEGLEIFNGTVARILKDIRFCGKEKLIQWCDEAVTVAGY